jgi:hypothetical protein
MLPNPFIQQSHPMHTPCTPHSPSIHTLYTPYSHRIQTAYLHPIRTPSQAPHAYKAEQLIRVSLPDVELLPSLLHVIRQRNAITKQTEKGDPPGVLTYHYSSIQLYSHYSSGKVES